MRSKLTFASLALALFSITPNLHAAACSTATISGDWGFTLTGVLLLPSGPVPVAAVLHGTAEVNGNVSGVEARSLGGDYADETFTGSWSVGSDCVGTAIVLFKENGQLARTSVVTIAFDDNSSHVRMLQKSLTLPNGTELPVVITIDGTKH